VLAQVSLPSISCFHCHVGQQFAPQALAAAKAEVSEAKLWSVVAALEEQQAVVLRHLSEHASADRGGHRSEHARKAREVSELLAAQIVEQVASPGPGARRPGPRPAAIPG
jgi:hypothetical protein